MDLLVQIGPMILLFVLMYVVLILPQQQESRKHAELLASLAKDDLVVTAGGLHGKVAAVAEQTVVVEVAPGARITVEKSSIAKKLPAASSAVQNG